MKWQFKVNLDLYEANVSKLYYKIIYLLKKKKKLLVNIYFVPGTWYKKMSMIFVLQEFTLN